jgi:hypothetical protein
LLDQRGYRRLGLRVVPRIEEHAPSAFGLKGCFQQVRLQGG